MFVCINGKQIQSSPYEVEIYESQKSVFPRLIRISGTAKDDLASTLLPLSYHSLGMEDVYILDNYVNIYQWNSTANSLKTARALSITRALSDQRLLSIDLYILNDIYDSNNPHVALFWSLLGVKEMHYPPINANNVLPVIPPRMFIVNNDKFEMVGLETKNDKLMIFDTGFEIFVWKEGIGDVIQNYIHQFRRPQYIKLTCVKNNDHPLLRVFFGVTTLL